MALVGRSGKQCRGAGRCPYGRPSLLIDAEGDYTLELSVHGDGRVSKPATVVLSTRNSRPVAIPKANRTVAPKSTVVLDAGASFDADADELGAQWALLSAPRGVETTIRQTGALTAISRLDVPGGYTFQLIVSDGQLDSEPVTQVIDVRRDVLSREAIEKMHESVLAQLGPERGNDDLDGDGIPDAKDNCVDRPNSDQRDTDDDGIGNAQQIALQAVPESR